MYQLPVIAVLTVAMFVGRVYPVPFKEVHSSSTVNVTATKNVTEVPTSNSTVVIGSPVVKASNKADTPKEALKSNKTESSVVSAPLSAKNDSAPISAKPAGGKEGQNCHYKKEAVDMLKCFVTPHDDDEAGDTTPRPNTTIGQESATKSAETSGEKGGLNKTIYHTASPETNRSTNINSADASSGDIRLNADHTEIIISSVAPLLVDNVRSIGSESNSDVTKSIDKDGNSMPGGVIALVTAITFALAIVFAYISVVAWRRYVEYRYGHRELLVNDLEFDTNDLRHFEL